MPEPRVFISSTFYDLRQIRADLDAFIRNVGYTPVRHEIGDIPYGKEEALEEYCYKEIEKCDILVSIIGGRYGHTSGSADGGYSVSQIELKVARRLEKQVYIFVEKSVFYEFEIYRSWPSEERDAFRTHYADNVKIHSFLSEVTSHTRNNVIFTFESASEIVAICKRQWAGLFQDLLLQQGRKPELDLVSRLNESIQVMDRLVKYFEDKDEGKTQDLLIDNHPFFHDLMANLGVGFNIRCYSLSELRALLEFLGWKKVNEPEWKTPDGMEWLKTEKGERLLIRIDRSLFDTNENLIPFTPQDWKKGQIEREVFQLQ